MGADFRALEAEEPAPPHYHQESRRFARTSAGQPVPAVPADRKEGGCREGRGCAKMNLITERGTDCIF